MGLIGNSDVNSDMLSGKWTRTKFGLMHAVGPVGANHYLIEVNGEMRLRPIESLTPFQWADSEGVAEGQVAPTGGWKE